MLKKMRWHFIFAAMTAVFIMLVLLVTGINVWNFYTTAKRADQRIQEIYMFESGNIVGSMSSGNVVPNSKEGENTLEGESTSTENIPTENIPAGSPEMFGRPEERDPEAPYTTRFFIVKLDLDGTVKAVSTDFIASVTKAETEEYAKSVISGKREHGYYKNYRYQVLTENNENIVIFLNATMELHSAGNVLLISCLALVICFLTVFFLVFLFSGKAMEPYLRNIERQKRFITDATHEIKTPLTSIATSIDVIEMEHGEDEWTKNIHNQTSKMTRMVTDLVMLSRLDEENPFPDKTEFSLSDAAWEVAEPFASLAKAQGKNYTQRIEENITLCGNPDAVRQLISVLLDNALKYSDENGTIRLDIYQIHGKKKIEVFNTCVLEDTKNLSRLFDRFYRPDASRSRKTGGTGIGLSIAKAVVEAHGGKIRVNSKDGRSIKFQVSL